MARSEARKQSIWNVSWIAAPVCDGLAMTVKLFAAQHGEILREAGAHGAAVAAE